MRICRALAGHQHRDRPEDVLGAPVPAAVAAGTEGRGLTEILAGIYRAGRARPPPAGVPVRQPEDVGAPEPAGHQVAKCTVERLMRAHGWRGVHPPARPAPRSQTGQHAAPDLVRRNFTARARPGQLHVAGLHLRAAGRRGLRLTALVIDAFAGLIAGWECSLSKETAFVERAIRQAAAWRARQERPLGDGAIHHSGAAAGSTPRSGSPQTLLLAGLTPSVGTVGDALDNALAETTIGLYKTECTRDGNRSGPARSGPWRTWRRSPAPGALVQHQPADAPAQPQAPGRS